VDLHSPRVLSLCAGGGGIDLGIQLAFPESLTVAYVEREAFACETLVQAMQRGFMDRSPIWTNVESFDGNPWRGIVDLVVAGYPCQPFSKAGSQKGTEDHRWLWPEIARIIREVRPRFAFFENVPGHIRLGFDVVLSDLASLGFDVEWTTLSASEVGATHGRERLWILAHSRSESTSPEQVEQHENGSDLFEGSDGKLGEVANTNNGPGTLQQERNHKKFGGWYRYCCEELGDTDIEGLEGRGKPINESSYRRSPWPPSPENDDAWEAVRKNEPSLEPAIRRMVDGDASQMDRLRLLGNGVVPVAAAMAFLHLLGRFQCRLNSYQ